QRPGHQGRSAVGAPAEPETPGPTPPEGGPKEPERLPAQGQSHLSDREEHTWHSQPRASERPYRQAAGPPPRRPSMNPDLNGKPVLPSSLRILCTRCWSCALFLASWGPAHSPPAPLAFLHEPSNQ
ncbi:hypothetical protein E2I00_016317, partial [Balaenoptera physalus]